MPHVLNEFTGDGVTQTFNFSMTDGYLSRDYVLFQTRPNDSILGYEDYDRSKITWLTDFSVRTAEPIPVGTTFVITRATPASALVDFQNTSRITERNLDTATRQSLHRTVEAADYVSRGIASTTGMAEVAAAARVLTHRMALLNQRMELLNQRTDKAVLSYPNYTAASDAVATLPDGQVIDVAVSNTRYSVSGGLLMDERPSTPVSVPSGVVRSVQSKLLDTVSVKDFGAVGDGVTDDTAAFNLSFAALGSAGGVVTVPNSMRCLIDSNLRVPVNVSLVGPHEYVGSPGRNNFTPFGSMGGALIVNSAATLTVGSNASISGFFIYRKGMTFPTVDASAFSGTAITIDGDDSAVAHCLVIGFNKAVYSSGDQRQRINNLWFDCVNGIEITNCLDIPHIHNCHGWPFATIDASSAGTPGASIIRAGRAYYLHDTVDWAKLTDCFSYGYFRGFELNAVNSCTLLSCGADNISSGGAPTYPGSVGFSIGGQENRLIGCQAAAQTIGVSVATNDGVMQTIVGLNIWACGDHGVLVFGGDLSISASNFRSVASGITVANSISKVLDGGGNRFESIGGSEWAVNVATNTSKVKIAPALSSKPAGGKLAGSNLVLETIASADPISPSINGDLFIVSGTTSFGGMNGGWAGRIVTLVFSDVLSVFSSTGSATAIRLASNATYTSSANSSITLLYTGSQWVEIGRGA